MAYYNNNYKNNYNNRRNNAQKAELAKNIEKGYVRHFKQAIANSPFSHNVNVVYEDELKCNKELDCIYEYEDCANWYGLKDAFGKTPEIKCMNKYMSKVAIIDVTISYRYAGGKEEKYKQIEQTYIYMGYDCKIFPVYINTNSNVPYHYQFQNYTNEIFRFLKL